MRKIGIFQLLEAFLKAFKGVLRPKKNSPPFIEISELNSLDKYFEKRKRKLKSGSKMLQNLFVFACSKTLVLILKIDFFAALCAAKKSKFFNLSKKRLYL